MRRRTAAPADCSACIAALCWSARIDGQYISEQHGSAEECYSFALAQKKCEQAADCHGITTQSSVCDGQYRVSHGTTATLVAYDNWEAFDLSSYTLDRSCLPESASFTSAAPPLAAVILPVRRSRCHAYRPLFATAWVPTINGSVWPTHAHGANCRPSSTSCLAICSLCMRCAVGLLAGDWVHCAPEHGTCYCRGTVRYGKHDTWSASTEVLSSIQCTNAVFGDPLYGTFKECQCKADGQATPTCGGTAYGAPCSFPFSYGGSSYDSCTAADHDQPWCYTEPLWLGLWGNCDCDADPPEVQLDCSVLPTSMNGAQNGAGCPGAVSMSGAPSEVYCGGGGSGEYPWWAECCEWVEDQCVPKRELLAALTRCWPPATARLRVWRRTARVCRR